MVMVLKVQVFLQSIVACYIFLFSCKAECVQYTEILKEYFLICGADYFCFDVDRINIFDVRPVHSYRHFGLCPECSCDKYCVLRGDCCPDLYFTLPGMERVNRTIIEKSKDNNREQMQYMVVKCPENTEPDVRSKCECDADIAFRLQHLPVTGGNFSLTYFNEFCAECHGVTDYLPWSLDIKCDHFADFNYLSNIKDVIQTAVDSNCAVQSFPSTGEKTMIPEFNEINENDTLFSKCNQTGTWNLYDVNIKHACESSFIGRYRLFKNVFCFICNPNDNQILRKNVIYECNITGQWKIYDEELERACVQLPGHHAVGPFKNIFCYICNRGNDSSQNFIDINATIQEYITEDSYFRYQYEIHVHSFSFQYLSYLLLTNLSVFGNINDEIYQPFSQTAFSLQNGTMIEFKNLISQAIALDEREVGTCPNRTSLLPPGFESRCICDPKCIFEDAFECCMDLALELPTVCVDELAWANIIDSRIRKKGYLFINGCFQERQNVVIKNLCSRPRLDDVFSLLPVTDKEKGVPYLNLYCLLCNMNIADYVNILNGFPSKNEYHGGTEDIFLTLKRAESQMEHKEIWNFQITCPSYLDYIHFVKLGDLMSQAWKQRCRILYKSSTRQSESCDQQYNFVNCKSFKNWTFTDKDTEWACSNLKNFPMLSPYNLLTEFPNINITWKNKTFRRTEIGNNVVQYPNLFCALCSPTINFSIEPIGICNATGIAHAFSYFNSMDLKCLRAQFIYYFYPFKNYFCVNCNGIPLFGSFTLAFPSDITIYKRAVSRKRPQVVGDSFSIFRDSLILRYDDDCDLNLIKCRNITCFAGKILQGNECKPLLTVTKNLYYHLTLTAMTTPRGSMVITDLISAVLTTIRHFVSSYVLEEGVLIPKLLGSVLSPCNSILDENDFSHVNVYVELFFPNSVRRYELEKKLINIHKQKINDTESFSLIELFGDRKPETKSISNIDISKVCSIENTSLNINSSASLRGKYYMAKVSNVLICPQFELSIDEYNISEDGSTLIIKKTKLKVDENQFGVTPDGQIRVCYDYLVSKSFLHYDETQEEPVSERNIRITSLICTVVSVISLLLVFVIYGLHPKLQIEAGKLIFLLLFNILLNVLFHVLSYFTSAIDILCITNGVFLHFTSLSVLTSLAVCLFHLYESSKCEQDQTNKAETHSMRKIIICMISVFGIPLIIVAINIGLTMFISNGSLMGYGGGKCFMDNKMSFILAFICPVPLIFLTFILIYLCTRRIINNNQDLCHKNRSWNLLRLLIWITMITGISYIFQIIVYFHPATIVSFLAVSIYSLQGMFVLIVFIIITREDLLYGRRLLDVNNESPLRFSSAMNIDEGNSSQSEQNTKL